MIYAYSRLLQRSEDSKRWQLRFVFCLHQWRRSCGVHRPAVLTPSFWQCGVQMCTLPYNKDNNDEIHFIDAGAIAVICPTG